MALFLAFTTLVPVYATEGVEVSEETSTTSEVSTSAYEVEPEQTYSISITAVDPDGGLLSDLEFRILSPSGNAMNFVKSNGVYMPADNGFYQTVATDSAGSFTLSGLSQGTYSIEYTNNNSNYVAGNTPRVDAGDGASVTINMKRNVGDMIFTLTGEDGSAIGGAKFVIVNSNGANVKFSGQNSDYTVGSGTETLETNTAGRFIVHALPVGDYTVKQTESPVEYNGDLVSQTFTVSLGNQTNVNATSEKRYGNVTITLSDGSASLNGGSFYITSSGGGKVYFQNGQFSRNSGSDSFAINGSITLKGLPVGNYTLVEASAPNGYVKAGDKSFSISKNDTTTVSVVNQQDVGSLRIEVKDGNTSDAIQGYGFTMADANGNVLSFVKNSDGDYTYSASGPESTLISNANGVILVGKLPPKTYVIKQSRAAAGYIIDVAESQQTITNGQTTTYEAKVYKSNTSISVLDESMAPLEGIAIEILNDDGNVVFEGQSNEEGKLLISGIPAGNYSYSIKNLGSPYVNKTYEARFAINSNGEVANMEPCIIEYNKVIVDIGQKVAGAKFTLTDATNNNNVLKAESDENGIVTFTKIADGVYTLKQTEAPAGYQVSDKQETVAIDRETKGALKFTFKNTVIGDESTSSTSEDESQTSEDPSRDPKSSFPIVPVIIGLLVLLAAIIFAVMKTKKDEEKEGAEANKPAGDKPEATKVIPPVSNLEFEKEPEPEPEEEVVEEPPMTAEERKPEFDTFVDPYEQEAIEKTETIIAEGVASVMDEQADKAEEVADDLAENAEEVEENIEEVKEDVAEAVEEIPAETEETLTSAEEAINEAEETAQEAISSIEEEASGEITENLAETEQAVQEDKEEASGESREEPEVKEVKTPTPNPRPNTNRSAKSNNYNRNKSKKRKKRR